MIWQRVHRTDARARDIADRHYSRQTVGAAEFVGPGRCLVLFAESPQGRAVWVTQWQFTEFSHHAWAGAWQCTMFRNEGAGLSSAMILEAVAATRSYMGEPPALGMITFVRPDRVRSTNPGYCFLRAGFQRVGMTGKGYIALQLTPGAMPAPERAEGLLL